VGWYVGVHSIRTAAQLDSIAQTLLHRAFTYEEEWALVPYLELINNELQWDPLSKTYANINNYHIRDRRYCNDANRDYSQGNQLFDVYQMNYNTIQYLHQYGFVTEENMLDYVTLRVSLPPNDPNIEAKLELLQQKSPVNVRWLPLSSDPASPRHTGRGCYAADV